MTPQEIHRLVLEIGSDRVGVFGGKYTGGVNLQQVPEEITQCLHYLNIATKIENYLEIGAASGGLTYLINKIFHPEIIVVVDNNSHTKSKYRANILKDVNHLQIIGDSQSKEVVGTIQGLPYKYDLVVIDADHRYEGTKKDVDNYKSLSRDFILLHDTVCCKGVKKVFEEFKEDEEFDFMDEFVSTTHHYPCGLGLFRRSK
jgi:predicted O-methyltransferase YrrM